MKTLKLHNLLPALLLVLAPLAIGCGREESGDEQVSIEEPRQQGPADESYDMGGNERIGEEPQDPEIRPQRQVVVVEPEIDEELSARERELARREAELAERERRLRNPVAPRDEPEERIARSEAPKPKPAPPAAKPRPQPKPEPEERVARKPEPQPAPPAATKPKPAPKAAPEANDRVARKPEPKPEAEDDLETEEIAERRREEPREDDNSGWVGRRDEREREERAEPRPSSVTVPAGTVVEVELLEDLSSQTSRVGDTFRARVASNVREDGSVAIPAGAEVVGEVTEVAAIRKVGGRARLAVKFTDLVLPSGATVPIDASFSQTGRNETGKDAATIGGAAAGGAVLGRILNKKDRSKGSVIGAIIGAAAGTVIASRTPGEEILIPRGTAMNLELRDSVRVRPSRR